MGYFKNINFNNYRNFSSYNISFDRGSNVILGKNGSGKTNILEGISLFEKGRGFRKDKIINLINYQNKDKGFKIDSDFKNEKNQLKISIFNSEKNLKKISVNESFEIESIKYFESLFSIIHFLPEMERLFIATPSFRRNFLDRLIFSSDKNYNLIVSSYKKLIYERQLILKKISFDEDWIEKVEKNIIKFGSIIYKKRILHIEIINKILQRISLPKNFSSEFILKLHDDFLEHNSKIYDDIDKYLYKIKNSRKNDFFSGRCAYGPHLSDLIGYNTNDNFNLNQLSTGQQKTIVLLIIIAQSEYLINSLNLKPVILLDEICSHLDLINRELLLYLINKLKVQVFMTGTEKSFFSFLSTKANYCNIT